MSQRPPVDRQRIDEFLEHLGKRFHKPARVYLVGGTSLIYEGFRGLTLDIDLTFDVADEDYREFIDVIRNLKEHLQLNIEEVSPGDFIPLPDGHRERARFLGRFGQVEVFHFDLYSTALSKVERGTEEDYEDVLALLRSGTINFEALSAFAEQILPLMGLASLRQNPERFRRNFAMLQELLGEREESRED